MSTFSLILKDSSTVTGTVHIPSQTRLRSVSKCKPLLVVVPGGSFTADFFDADDNHSLRPICELLGIPAVALDRPGYGGTPPPTGLDKSSNSFIQKTGRWLHELALPAIWSAYADELAVSSIVLYGHSIGGSVCIVAAAEYARERSAYKMSGLSIAGIGCEPASNDFDAMFEEEHKSPNGTPLRSLMFPIEPFNTFMHGDVPETFDPAITLQTERLQHRIYLQELYDVEFLWPKYWESYAKLITIPVLYNGGDLDLLLQINPDTMRRFGAGFSASTWVSLVMSRDAPHAVEHSHQACGYYIRLLGFAVECAVQSEIKLQIYERS